MPFQIVQGDLTKMRTDAVVNAANNHLAEGGGVCGAIFQAAGRRQLAAECSAAGYCETGQSVMTKGYGLPAPFIIHTVGPVWRGGGQGERELLQSCYRTALNLAQQKGLESIAFPLISSGIFGYPKDLAFAVASETVKEFLAEYEMDVWLVLFDKGTFMVEPGLKQKIADYININFQGVGFRTSEKFAEADEAVAENVLSMEEMAVCRAAPAMAEQVQASDLEHLLGDLEEGFSRMLFRLIAEKDVDEVAVYKRANIDRKHFAKMKKDPAYKPKKNTVLAFAIALQLNLAETRKFLEQAGFALSHASKQDVIIEYFISQEIHDIFQINQALFAFDQIPLGCC